jgi:thioredoxin 1
MSKVKHIGDAKFEAEVEKSDRLSIVDFGAAWCGPCKKLHPIMEELAGVYGDRVHIFQVDVEHSPQTAIKYGITSLPALLFFKNGIVKENIVGLISKTKIEEKIERYLA